jgi:hypothetical protein
MKYATINASGATEVREDSRADLPAGGVALTDEQYDQLCSGSHVLVDGAVVENPNPPSFP